MTPQEELELIRIRARARAQANATEQASATPSAAPTTASDPRQRAVIDRLRARNPGWRTLPDAEVLSRGWGTLAPTERDRLFPEGVGLRRERSQNLANDVRSIPNLDLGRSVSDVAAAASRDWNSFSQDPGGSIMRAVAGLPAAIWDSTVGASGRAQNAQDAQMADLVGGDRGAAVDQARIANRENTRSFYGTMSLAASPLATTPLRGALLGIGATFPQALEGDGSLQDRLPQAVVSSAEAAALGSALPATGIFGRAMGRRLRGGAANGNVRPPVSIDENLATLDRAQVPATWSALNAAENAPVTMAMAESPTGFGARSNLANIDSIIGQRLDEARAPYGEAHAPEDAGSTVRAGIDRFNAQPSPQQLAVARQASGGTLEGINDLPSNRYGFRTKANLLYDHVLRPIAANPAGTDATNAVLHSIENEVRLSPDRAVTQLMDRVTGGRPLTLENLRQLREDIRAAQNDAMMANRNQGHLQRLEQALTQDMYQAAGPAARDLQQVDRYYRTGAARISASLARVDHSSNAAAFETMRRWAGSKAGADTRSLARVRQSMRPDDWRTVGASVIQRMGTVADAEGERFSPYQFAREFNRMTPRGQRLMFGELGPGGEGAHLARLRQVTDAIGLYARNKAFENFSRTSTHDGWKGLMRDVAGTGGAYAFGPQAATAATVYLLGRYLGTVALGELLTNPVFVRWVTLPAVRSPAAIAGRLGELGRLAARDPSLVPAYRALAQEQQPQAQQSEPQPGPAAGADAQQPYALGLQQ